ncbi:hypothetical protein MHI58_06905 [Bacillus sp. FSL K6-2869]|uniref:hypothetical protein n=1 Tax=Bacillus TaxID=1386 RepID=UPI001FACF94E|nr:hypothetical protein [Bacillus altitudinis]MCI9883878.1 hypothetical protein [Bacillus altitudinis]
MRNNWFDFFRHYGLEKLNDYAEHIENTFNHELVEIDKYIDKFETEEEKEFHVDRIYDDIATYRDEFPKIMRYSLLISIYSHLEHELNKLCRYYNKEGFKKYKTQENGIKRSQEFIKNELNMNFPDRSKEWTFICNVKEIRNCLVHAQGYIDEMKDKNDKSETNDHLKKKSGKSETKVGKAINALGKDLVSVIKGTNQIELHENFNKEFIKHVKTFLDNLDEINQSPPDN